MHLTPSPPSSLQHMHYADPLVKTILNAIRASSVLGRTVPIQFLTGHSHVRASARLDAHASTLEAGKYADTLGFASFNTSRRIPLGFGANSVGAKPAVGAKPVGAKGDLGPLGFGANPLGAKPVGAKGDWGYSASRRRLKGALQLLINRYG